MDIFSFDENENRQFVDDILRFNHISEKQINPGVFSVSDLIVEPIRGVDRGLNKLSYAIGAPATELLSPIAKRVDEYAGTDIQGYLDEQLGIVRKNIELQTPDPTVTTVTGQILNGLGDVMSRAGVGVLSGGVAGGAVLAGGTEAIFLDDEGRRKGLDAETSAGRAVIEGVTLGLGAAMPAAPYAKTLLSRLASGAVSNTALGIAQRGITGAYLEDRGYQDMARQYKVWDATALIADTVLGAAFGGFAHAGAPATPAAVDAALTARNAQYFREDTAPGLPADMASNVAHQRALDTASEQLNSGEPVDVSGVEGVFDANFIGRELPSIKPDDASAQSNAPQVDVTYKPDTASETVTQNVDPLLRDIDNANQVLARRGDIAVRVEDDLGSSFQRSATEMLRDDDALITRAEQDARGVMAAIECELRHGHQ
ncbi:hypothetical protein [Symbiopectobacterium purcellii]|uniref:hypothetical protein n=1 Tax=Symbiopectobacterium purcellii TaxID=2871826 RepID=UPI003F854555